MLCLAQRANELVLEHPANTYSMLPQHTAVVGRLERMHGVLGKVRLLSVSGTTSSVSPSCVWDWWGLLSLVLQEWL